MQSSFLKKYYGKIVSWDGYLVKANINQGWFPGEHAAILLIKMQPTESEIYADLILTFNENDFKLNKRIIASLDRGDRLAFNATLMAVADEETIHHLHGHQIQKIEGHLDIPFSMQNNYRNSVFVPSVEIVSIVDKPNLVDHEHVHYYNETFNQTLE